MTPPTSIDGTDITGATIDGQDVQEITIDGQTVFASIPATVDFRWTFAGSTPFVDTISGVTATNNGTVEVSGDFVGGTARESNTSNNGFVNLTSLTDFGSAINGEMSIAMTIQTTDDSIGLFGISRDVDQEYSLGIGPNFSESGNASASGELEWHIRDDNKNNETVRTDVTVNDGNERRVVLRKEAGTDASVMEINVDGDPNTSNTISFSQGAGSFRDFNIGLFSHALNENGSPTDRGNQTIDDLIIDEGTYWTAQQVQDDFNRQPYS